MSTSKNGGSRNRRLLLTSMADIGLMLGAAGIASATTSANPVQPPVVTPSVTAPAVTEAPDANDEVDGVDCEDGINTKTGFKCDGGPAAN